MEAIRAIAVEAGIPMHLDGARLGNAIVASGRSGAELAKPFETISMCFSKGLGAPIGSVLVGSKDQIAQAIRYRKMYGGGMRQGGVLAAAGLYALRNQIQDLAMDHVHAQQVAKALDGISGVRVDCAGVHTNLVYFEVDSKHPVMADGDRAFLRTMRDEEGTAHWGRCPLSCSASPGSWCRGRRPGDRNHESCPEAVGEGEI